MCFVSHLSACFVDYDKPLEINMFSHLCYIKLVLDLVMISGESQFKTLRLFSKQTTKRKQGKNP